MTIKTIVACLTEETSADSLMHAASLLAQRYNAHLIGLHAVEALMVYPAIAKHIPHMAYDTYGASQMEQSNALKATFERHTHAEDFVSEWRLIKCESETATDRTIENAHCADLVLMAAPTPNNDSVAHVRLVENIIRNAGRPVIVVPPVFEGDTLGQSILIGWNGTREAARAAHDALTILQEGDTAHIMRINDSSCDADGDATSNDLAAAFARHGIDTTLVHKTWEQPGVAVALIKEAFEKGADMIAIGAFGHSRVYDLVIGAATRELLRQSELPVMFSR